MFVWQPALSTSLRQRDERFSHALSFVLDIVTAASTDALDAVSSASRENEAGTFDNSASFEPNSRDKWTLRYGVHFEEPWRSGFGGFGYAGNFNDNNTTFATSVNFIFDNFDDLQPRGWNETQTQRYTLNDNLSLTQVLSPTTLAVISYGLTFQLGTLENGWNSVYIRDGADVRVLGRPGAGGALRLPEPPAGPLAAHAHAPRDRAAAQPAHPPHPLHPQGPLPLLPRRLQAASAHRRGVLLPVDGPPVLSAAGLSAALAVGGRVLHDVDQRARHRPALLHRGLGSRRLLLPPGARSRASSTSRRPTRRRGAPPTSTSATLATSEPTISA